jgi:hypothetical protein
MSHPSDSNHPSSQSSSAQTAHPNPTTPQTANIPAQPDAQDEKLQLPPRRPVTKPASVAKLRPWLIAGAFLVAICVALNPSIGYAPVPRVVLFFLLAVLFTLLFVGELDARFEMKLPGFIFSSTGVLAAMCGLLVLLNHLAAPEVQATRFTLRHTEIPTLHFTSEMIKVKAGQGVNASMPYFFSGEDLYVIFPPGVNTAEISVNPTGDGWFRKELGYAGNRQVFYQIDKEFTRQ